VCGKNKELFVSFSHHPPPLPHRSSTVVLVLVYYLAKPLLSDIMAKPPSSTLLSILAIIASSTANAAPPTFLCPSLNYKSSPTIPSTPRRIPSKFEQGEDGRWRRVDSYTLYGSTVLYIGVSYQRPRSHSLIS